MTTNLNQLAAMIRHIHDDVKAGLMPYEDRFDEIEKLIAQMKEAVK